MKEAAIFCAVFLALAIGPAGVDGFVLEEITACVLKIALMLLIVGGYVYYVLVYQARRKRNSQ